MRLASVRHSACCWYCTNIYHHSSCCFLAQPGFSVGLYDSFHFDVTYMNKTLDVNLMSCPAWCWKVIIGKCRKQFAVFSFVSILAQHNVFMPRRVLYVSRPSANSGAWPVRSYWLRPWRLWPGSPSPWSPTTWTVGAFEYNSLVCHSVCRLASGVYLFDQPLQCHVLYSTIDDPPWLHRHAF